MLKKIVPGIVAASAVIFSTVLPSMADDDTACSVVCFPFKVVGSTLSMIVGVPLGVLPVPFMVLKLDMTNHLAVNPLLLKKTKG